MLSAETFNEGPDVIVAMVTSSQGRLARADIGDVVIGEWRAAGLLRPSLIRTGRVLVLERRLLSLPLGKLTTSDLAEVIRGLRTVFGLD